MAVQSSKYEVFKIKSSNGEREVDLIDGPYSGGTRVVNIYYYENVLSPHITGVITLVSTGDAVSKEGDEGTTGSLYEYLPLEAGCELLMRIKTEIGEGIDYAVKDDPHRILYINEVQILDKQANSETIQIRFCSRIGVLNAVKKVTSCYKGNISESVASICKDVLTLPADRVLVSESSNTYTFAGMTKRPFDLIAMLAKQTIPMNTANPGYFAYETKSGFKFVSLDSLINTEPDDKTHHYFYNSQNKDVHQTDSDANNFKVSALVVGRDQNLTSQIRSGIYASKNIFFNPATYQFTEIDINVVDGKLIDDEKFSSLGNKPTVAKILDEEFEGGTRFHRVSTAVMNIGGADTSVDANNSPELYYAAGAARYNILFSQNYSIVVPCNTDLEAGDTIKLEVEVISSNKESGPDQKTSGTYIIQSLCHFFEAEKSVTSMKLIRDSYGMHFSKSETPKEMEKVAIKNKRGRTTGYKWVEVKD